MTISERAYSNGRWVMSLRCAVSLNDTGARKDTYTSLLVGGFGWPHAGSWVTGPLRCSTSAAAAQRGSRS